MIRLHPRLPPYVALPLYTQLAAANADDLEAAVAYEHPAMTWAATGATRLSVAEMKELRSSLLEVAHVHGYPEELSNAARVAFDRSAARRLLELGRLAPVEASVPDVWSFHALVLCPDIVFWRARDSQNKERFVASDLTRHTLSRLWWRAYSMAAPPAPDDAWTLFDAFGEADFDQLQTRRNAYGDSPTLVRALARCYVRLREDGERRGMTMRDAWRKQFLSPLARIGAFVQFSAMDEDVLQTEMFALMNELAGGDPMSPAPDQEPPPEPAAGSRPETGSHTFDSLPLREFTPLIAETVSQSGELRDDDLAPAFTQLTGIEIPTNCATILNGFAWQANALDMVSLDRDAGVWRPGSNRPAADPRWGDWSIERLIDHVRDGAAEMDDEALADEIFDGRATRTVRRVIRRARRNATRSVP